MHWRQCSLLLSLMCVVCVINAMDIDDYLSSVAHYVQAGLFTRAKMAIDNADAVANNAAQWRAVAVCRHQLGAAMLQANLLVRHEKAAPELRIAAELLRMASTESTLEHKAHARLMQGFCLQRLGAHEEAAACIEASLEEDRSTGRHQRHMHNYVADFAASEDDMPRALRHFGLGSHVHRPLRADLLATRPPSKGGVPDDHKEVKPSAMGNALPAPVWLQLQHGLGVGSHFWKVYQGRGSFGYRLSDPPRNAIHEAIQLFLPRASSGKRPTSNCTNESSSSPATYAEWWVNLRRPFENLANLTGVATVGTPLHRHRARREGAWPRQITVYRVSGEGGGTNLALEDPDDSSDIPRGWLVELSPNTALRIPGHLLFGASPAHSKAWRANTKGAAGGEAAWCLELAVAFWEEEPCNLTPRRPCRPSSHVGLWEEEFVSDTEEPPALEEASLNETSKGNRTKAPASKALAATKQEAIPVAVVEHPWA